jgi:very-short-patch-repair endonuclease
VKQRRSQAERNFEAKVDRSRGEDACHPWTAARSGSGYGATLIGGRQVGSHRVAWEFAHGSIPEGMLVCHRCDNPICCNPRHLFLGTTQINMNDKVTKARQAFGIRNGRAKLTAEQVEFIRLHGGQRNNRTLGRRFGVSDTAVRLIVQGKSWKRRSEAEEAFATAWRILARAEEPPVREHVFHPVRKWRFDFCWPARRLAVEIDGRAKGKPDAVGRHQTVDGVRKDCEKNNAAIMLGWRIMRFPATDKQKANAWVKLVQQVLAASPLVTDACAVCGCTEEDCSQCVERTGEPCYWVSPGLCSACAGSSR